MKFNLLGILLIAMAATGCSENASTAVRSASSLVDSIAHDKWAQLASRRIFFAHMSLGHNIMQGVQELERDEPRVRVRLVETRAARDLETPGLAHALNGENGDPLGKITAFRSALDGGLGAKADVALMKFCFVDFRTNEQVPAVFNEYRKTMADLKARYPRLTLVHMTVPLTVVQTGPKAWVKTIIGRPVYGVGENIARNELNELLRREYDGKEPLIDVASWEATRLDGSRSDFTDGSRTYDQMSAEYASDSGHLNAAGRRWMAARFLGFLASLPASDVSE